MTLTSANMYICNFRSLILVASYRLHILNQKRFSNYYSIFSFSMGKTVMHNIINIQIHQEGCTVFYWSNGIKLTNICLYQLGCLLAGTILVEVFNKRKLAKK
jgi:hypothetical protein